MLLRGTRALGALAALAMAFAPAASAQSGSPYASAPFDVQTHPYAFGQAPVFMPDGRVVFGKDFKQGDKAQVYIANQDGSGLKCLTCGMTGPNNVPAVSPQGDWIIFHSWFNQHLTIGSPGYGGMGSVLYAMKPDGSRITRLTGLGPADTGEGEDDYHAYFSPDGKRIVYTHLNWNFVTDNGQGKWDVRVADFITTGPGAPRIANVRIVRPANGHWYETQWWAPDGSGFLYTETTGTALDTELFFCKLPATGECQPKQLTDNPSWNEQAIFTPDGKEILFMSSRDSPNSFNTWAQITRAAGLTTNEDYLLILPIFEVSFLQPVAEETTDLYQLDPTTGIVHRRLTFDGTDGWIVPEFTWDPKNNHLWFTENRLPPGARVSLPFDPVKELREAAAFLENPPTPDGSKAAALDVVLPVEQRTRILTFKLPGGYSPPVGNALAVRPVLSNLRIGARWRLGSQLPSAARVAPVGTTIRFALSQPGTARLEFLQSKPGRRVGGRCVAENRSNRGRRRCSRVVSAGSLSIGASAGANKVRFQGRVSRERKLKPGHYTLRATATNSAGRRSEPKTARFTVLAAG
ncbi:MAG: TolB protein [Solirubrobacteraceae bacterium]|nr:TolB protein [Solirubrobacteraceae bacterium]